MQNDALQKIMSPTYLAPAVELLLSLLEKELEHFTILFRVLNACAVVGQQTGPILHAACTNSKHKQQISPTDNLRINPMDQACQCNHTPIACITPTNLIYEPHQQIDPTNPVYETTEQTSRQSYTISRACSNV